MNRDQARGRIKEVKGKVKEVAGRAVGDVNLEMKGKMQKAAGQAQAGFGDLKNALKKRP